MKKTLVLTFPLFLMIVFCLTVMGKEPHDVMSPSYRVFWNDDVQKQIDERIEKYRKANATVELSQVRPHTKITIEQTRHAFLFGAHIFNFNQLGTDRRNEKYKELYGTLFNSATIPFYWKTFEPEKGKPRFAATYEDSAEFWNQQTEPYKQPHWRRPATDPVVEFCESKGIRMNGHPLTWGNRQWHHPDWLSNDPAKLKEMEQIFEKRIREIAAHYQGRIDRYDVVNESATDYRLVKQGILAKTENLHRNSSYGLMPYDYTYKSFQWAQSAFPDQVKFNINDNAVDKWYAMQVNELIDRGCRIDYVGIQMHLFNPQETMDVALGKEIQTPAVQEKRLSAADKTKRPLHLSEITITAPDDSETGRAIQAEVARNLYRFWFSWPSMMAITWWNVVDNCGAPGEPTTSGLFTRDMEPKPVFFALNKLINEEWKTRIVIQAETENVLHDFRGFKGTYKITWTDKNGNIQSKTLDVQ